MCISTRNTNINFNKNERNDLQMQDLNTEYLEILLTIASMKTDYEKMEQGNQSAAKRIRQKIRLTINLLKNERIRLLELSKNI
jgi:predicted P-loop ATPase